MDRTEHTPTKLMRPPTHNQYGRFTRIAFILPNTAEEAFLFPVVRNNFVVRSNHADRCASISECEAVGRKNSVRQQNQSDSCETISKC
jgi:hypothetical protein